MAGTGLPTHNWAQDSSVHQAALTALPTTRGSSVSLVPGVSGHALTVPSGVLVNSTVQNFLCHSTVDLLYPFSLTTWLLFEAGMNTSVLSVGTQSGAELLRVGLQSNATSASPGIVVSLGSFTSSIVYSPLLNGDHWLHLALTVDSVRLVSDLYLNASLVQSCQSLNWRPSAPRTRPSSCDWVVVATMTRLTHQVAGCFRPNPAAPPTGVRSHWMRSPR